MQDTNKIYVGVSRCLLGQKVRFDGGHKRDRFVDDILSKYVDFVPICPEVAIGMGVPREPIHLLGDPENPKVVGIKNTGLDVTRELKQYSKQAVKQLQHVSAYILKSKSPTCGMERVKVYSPKGGATNTGVGVFARALMQQFPNLPIEEEGRLNDPILRENFIERLFAYHAWQQLCADKLTMRKLVEFHTVHKLAVMAHSVAGYKRLGQLVANHDCLSIGKLGRLYETELMRIMKLRANRKGHSNVLYHMLGYFKADLDNADKQELVDLIEQYRTGLVPLVVPITLFKHYLRVYPKEYIEQQTYLHPHPSELMLRNHL